MSLALVHPVDEENDDIGLVIDVFLNNENFGSENKSIIEGERLEGLLKLQGCLSENDRLDVDFSALTLSTK